MSRIVAVVEGISGVSACRREDQRQIQRRLDSLGVSMPDKHGAALAEANGISVYHGYFRLFGIGCDECRDLTKWNDPNTWRFAWPASLASYIVFGETAWGDQYAYSRDELARGTETVYQLDAYEMEPEVIASTFEEFFYEEFMRCAESPYDSMLLRSAEKFGALRWEQQLTYIPSLLLGGEEAVDNVHVLDARVNMIINGDIATQVHEHGDGAVAAIDNYLDDAGRLRTRLIWVC